MDKETFLKSEMGEYVLGLIAENIDFEVRRGTSGRFENPHYYVNISNKKSKRYIQHCFYGHNGERFTTNFRDVPFHLPLPFATESKMPILCVKCYTKFELQDHLAMTCDDEEWICVKCKGDNNKEFKPPSGIGVQPLVLSEKKKGNDGEPE